MTDTTEREVPRGWWVEKWRCGCRRHHNELVKQCSRCGYERPHMPAGERAFWCIESNQNTARAEWWSGWREDGTGFKWSADITDAMRYATKEHAEQVIHDTFRIITPRPVATEHTWVSGPPRSPEVPRG